MPVKKKRPSPSVAWRLGKPEFARVESFVHQDDVAELRLHAKLLNRKRRNGPPVVLKSPFERES